MSVSKSRSSSRADSEPAPASQEKVLAILGGSSAFTPALAGALADAARELPPLEIRLHGRNEERLSAVARFCNRHVRARSVPHEYTRMNAIASSKITQDNTDSSLLHFERPGAAVMALRLLCPPDSPPPRGSRQAARQFRPALA